MPMLRRSRKRRPAKTRTKSSLALPKLRFNGLLVHRAVAAVLALAALVGLVIGWMLGVPRLQALASERALATESQESTSMLVRFTDLPRWVKPELRGMLAETARQQISGDPLARHDLINARQALLETGWFDQVEQVRRAGRNEIEVRGTLVDPFAYVRDGQADHLVDRTGRLLPHQVPAGGGRLTVITGVHFPRPPRAMIIWDGEDLTAGLRVLRLLETRAWRDQIVSIDVAEYLRHERLRLLTNRGTTIVWGRAPGAERTGEVAAAQKLAYLDFSYESFGHVDRNCPRELDITGDIVVGR